MCMLTKYKSKISQKQFVFDVVDFMLTKYNVTHEDIINLQHAPNGTYSRNMDNVYQENWFQYYTFDALDEYKEYMRYFYEHYKDYAPKYKWKKSIIDRFFQEFDFMYGLQINYDYEKHKEFVLNNTMYNEIYGKKK